LNRNVNKPWALLVVTVCFPSVSRALEIELNENLRKVHTVQWNSAFIKFNAKNIPVGIIFSYHQLQIVIPVRSKTKGKSLLKSYSATSDTSENAFICL